MYIFQCVCVGGVSMCTCVCSCTRVCVYVLAYLLIMPPDYSTINSQNAWPGIGGHCPKSWSKNVCQPSKKSENGEWSGEYHWVTVRISISLNPFARDFYIQQFPRLPTALAKTALKKKEKKGFHSRCLLGVFLLFICNKYSLYGYY